MEILENQVVQKYFGCEVFGCCAETEGEPVHRSGLDCRRSVALLVLRAMQEPIRKGERYLLIDCEVICEKIAESTSLDHTKHLGALRLPSQFQPEMVVIKNVHVHRWQCHCGELFYVPKSPPAEVKGTVPASWAGCVTPAPKKCDENCLHEDKKPADSGKCGCQNPYHRKEYPEEHKHDSETAVENKIDFIAHRSWKMNCPAGNSIILHYEPSKLEKELRELVSLARATK